MFLIDSVETNGELLLYKFAGQRPGCGLVAAIGQTNPGTLKPHSGWRPEIASARISLFVYSKMLPVVIPRASLVKRTFESAS